MGWSVVSPPDKWPRALRLALVGMLLGLVWWADCATGPEIGFSIFYVVPVALATWYEGRGAGAVVSFLSAVGWLLADMVTRAAHSHAAVPYWNAIVRLAFFSIVTWTLSALHSTRRLREQMASFIVHDLRTPLVTLQMALDAARGPATDMSQQARMLDLASASAQRVMALVSALLDSSRLGAGKMPVRVTQVDVGSLVSGAISQVSVWARNYGVAIHTDLPAEAAGVSADREITTRVLVNLLSNAIRYSPADSTITIASRMSGDDEVTFSVTDRGPGTPAEWRERIFDPYVQVKGREAGVAVGTGLGLAFCRLAVRAQNGRIWLEAPREGGTRVLFTLPRAG